VKENRDINVSTKMGSKRDLAARSCASVCLQNLERLSGVSTSPSDTAGDDRDLSFEKGRT
jgi:hypothetical protein